MNNMGNNLMIPELPELPLNSEEKTALITQLWLCLEDQTKRYTMGDSSSVRMETAEELFRSICFTLNLCIKEGLLQYGEIAAVGNTRLLMKKGESLIEKKVQEGRGLFEKVVDNPPGIHNISYNYTIAGIETFFKKYDRHFFAHEVPADIDYQLCIPVPEDLQGIEYINEYLRRILYENTFLRKFNRGAVISLFEGHFPLWRQLPLNLFDPVATNAVGLALIGKDPTGLDISREDEEILVNIFRSSDKERSVKLLNTASVCAAAAAGTAGPEHEAYLACHAMSLYPRIKAALKSGRLDGVFLNLPYQQNGLS